MQTQIYPVLRECHQYQLSSAVSFEIYYYYKAVLERKKIYPQLQPGVRMGSSAIKVFKIRINMYCLLSK